MILPGKERIISVLDHRLTQAIAVLFLIYFLWMDIALYMTVQNTQPLLPPKNNATVIAKPAPSPLSPFAGMSIKLIMTDQMCHYVETPVAKIIDAVTNISTHYWISPNMISFCGMMFALAAGCCVSYDHPGLHLIAVFLMFIRGLLDALDGIVARERVGVAQFLSLRNTSGYVVDAVADTVGYTGFLIGCLIFLRRNVQKQKFYLPLQNVISSTSKAVGSHLSQATWITRKITIAMFCFGFQIAASCAFWDRFCDKYHKLLETPRPLYSQAIVQNEVLKSNLMWIIAWLWRMLNSHALMNFFLGAVLINKMSGFLLWVQYIGYVVIFSLVIFTEIHLRDVQTYIDGIH